MTTIEQPEFQVISGEVNEIEEKETIGEFVHSRLTNFLYNIKHSNYLSIPTLHRDRITFDQQTKAYLHGQMYTLANHQAFQDRFATTVWMSYRKHIKNLGTDSGWGCMIRVVQMLLAEACQRSDRMEAKQVVDYFRDDERAPLSLVKICQAGNIVRRWTNATEIVQSCKKLLPSDFKFDIQNQTLGCLLPKKLYKSFTPSKHKLIVVSVRLGADALQPEYIPHLKSLMEIRWFAGCLAGVSGQALYVMGYCGDSMICLDPHYVQDAASPSEQVYFKNTARGISWNKLSPSVSLCFLVQDQTDFSNFLCKLLELQKKHTHHALATVFDSPAEKKLYQRSINTSDDCFEVITEV